MALFNPFSSNSNLKNSPLLKDDVVQMNIENWLYALKGSDAEQIQSARAYFKYDVLKRYERDYNKIVPYVEQVLIPEALAG